jgi:hypothetical protein
MLPCSERYTKYSQVMTPYTEDWGDNRTMEWYAGKKVDNVGSSDFEIF